MGGSNCDLGGRKNLIRGGDRIVWIPNRWNFLEKTHPSVMSLKNHIDQIDVIIKISPINYIKTHQ